MPEGAPEPRSNCTACRGRGGWQDAFGWVTCPCVTRQMYDDAYGRVKASLNKVGGRCELCNNRGGVRVNGKWIKCSCTRVTKDQRAMMRALHSIGAKNEQRRLFD